MPIRTVADSTTRQSLGIWISSTVALVVTVASAAFVIECWATWLRGGW